MTTLEQDLELSLDWVYIRESARTHLRCLMDSRTRVGSDTRQLERCQRLVEQWQAGLPALRRCDVRLILTSGEPGDVKWQASNRGRTAAGNTVPSALRALATVLEGFEGGE